MCLPPLGYRGDAREIVAFYRAVGAGTDLPLMAYNNPEASGIDLPAELIARLSDEVDQVVAVKECSGDARRIPAIIDAAPSLEVLVGGDDWALEGFAAGATGWVSGVADVGAGRVRRALRGLPAAGELERARAVYRRLLPLARLDMTPKLVQYFKGAQDALGFAGGPVRAAAARARRRPTARCSTPRSRRCARPSTSACGRRATSRRSTPTRRGCRRASSPAASARSRARRCSSASCTSRREMDDLRLLLMREPRGHGAMSGAILQPPTRAGRRLGRAVHRGLAAACRCAGTGRSASRPCWWRPAWSR